MLSTYGAFSTAYLYASAISACTTVGSVDRSATPQIQACTSYRSTKNSSSRDN